MLALSPVLVAQALRVRRIALVMPEPEGPREGEAGQGQGLALLICGDSSAAGVGAPHQSQALSGRLVEDLARDHALTWRLVARSGWTTRQAAEDLRSRPPLPSGATRRAAVVALGVNDITRQVPLRRWLQQVDALVDLLVERHGVEQVYWSGLPPFERFPLLPQPLRAVMAAKARRHDDALAAFAAGHPGLTRVAMDLDPARSETAEDGFHPAPSVYAQWAACLAESIRADRRLGRPR